MIRMAKDIVCKAEVDENTEWISEYQGKKYYFDVSGCKDTFDLNPEHWLKRAQ